MSNQQIIVYIEEQQLIAQKNNNYSLYLAKKVNDTFTVIWLSEPPFSTADQPAYQYKNVFDITNASYMVNFTNTQLPEGDIIFTSGGKNLPISTGQMTTLDKYGVFSTANSGGTARTITIINELKGNPREILLDSKGRNIWVDCSNGMNIGTTIVTPNNEFQLWFGTTQVTGSLIPDNVSNAGSVTVNDGIPQSITYTNDGVWVLGAPVMSLTTKQLAELHIRVTMAVAIAASTARATSR
jgi:hypothetical protein